MSLPERVARAIDDLRSDTSDPLCAYLYDLPDLERHVRNMREIGRAHV